MKIPLNMIALFTFSPRSYEHPRKLKELIESIKEEGDVREPITVKTRTNVKKKSPDNPTGLEYVIIRGKRRRRAALEAGLTEISADIWDISDADARMEALMDNCGSEEVGELDLTINVMVCLQELLGMHEKDVITLLQRMRNGNKVLNDMLSGTESGAPTAEKVEQIIQFFKKLAWVKWQSFVTNKIPMLKYPQPVKVALRQRVISGQNARLLAAMDDTRKRDQIIELVQLKKLKNSQIPEAIGCHRPIAQSLSQQLKRIEKLISVNALQTNSPTYSELERLLERIEQEAGMVMPTTAVQQARPLN